MNLTHNYKGSLCIDFPLYLHQSILALVQTKSQIRKDQTYKKLFSTPSNGYKITQNKYTDFSQSMLQISHFRLINKYRTYLLLRHILQKIQLSACNCTILSLHLSSRNGIKLPINFSVHPSNSDLRFAYQ